MCVWACVLLENDVSSPGKRATGERSEDAGPGEFLYFFFLLDNKKELQSIINSFYIWEICLLTYKICMLSKFLLTSVPLTPCRAFLFFSLSWRGLGEWALKIKHMFLQVCGSRGPQRIVLGYGGGQAESGLDRDSAEWIQTEGEQRGQGCCIFKKWVQEVFAFAYCWVCVVLEFTLQVQSRGKPSLCKTASSPFQRLLCGLKCGAVCVCVVFNWKCLFVSEMGWGWSGLLCKPQLKGGIFFIDCETPSGNT